MNHPTASRATLLNAKPVQGDKPKVIYWMQQSQRFADNAALCFAQELANEHQLPLQTVFVIDAGFPEATSRHFQFMAEGLVETAAQFRRHGLELAVVAGHPLRKIRALGRSAAAIVCDRGYLRELRRWRAQLAAQASCAVWEVDADCIVPVHVASPKAEMAAMTLRPKIHRVLEAWLELPRLPQPARPPLAERLAGALPTDSAASLLAALRPAPRPLPLARPWPGGARQALRRFKAYLAAGLADYASKRTRSLGDDTTSRMSPYLQYGQVSPLRLYLLARDHAAGPAGSTAMNEAFAGYAEQLIVRRELAHNYVFYVDDHDSYASMPAWAQKTLEATCDEREDAYTPAQLEGAATDDPAWNAAQAQMVTTGYMHNYMRMYWAKQILRWHRDPAQAYAIALELNNRYLLDGINANSYTGVGWVFGLHDRPWPAQPGFGKVRAMTAAGLKRKFDIDAYIGRNLAGDLLAE